MTLKGFLKNEWPSFATVQFFLMVFIPTKGTFFLLRKQMRLDNNAAISAYSFSYLEEDDEAFWQSSSNFSQRIEILWPAILN